MAMNGYNVLVIGPELIEADDVDKLECTDCLSVVVADSDDAVGWMETTDSDTVCDGCADDYYNCNVCNDTVHSDNVREVRDNVVCHRCFDDEAVYCFQCGLYEWRDDAYYIEQRNGHVCMSCGDEYVCCENCESMVHMDDMGYDGYSCTDCSDDEGEPCYDGVNVRRWGDKPNLVFVSPDRQEQTPKNRSWYMGMEIEIEGSNDAVVNALPLLGDYVYATTDSSLHGGLEVITHPGTFDAWMDGTLFDWDVWTREMHNKTAKQDEYTSNGIHVHVSRTAFKDSKGRQRASHLYKFMQFVDKHKYAMHDLAGRGDSTYSRWAVEDQAIDRVKDAKGSASGFRHRPVNCTNYDTVELRFFDGRTNPTFMKRTIQLIHAMVEFTRITRAKDNRGWGVFLSYVTKHKDIYGELHAYILSHAHALRTEVDESIAEYNAVVVPAIKKANEDRIKNQSQTPDPFGYEYVDRYDDVDDPCECEYCTTERL